LQKNPVLKHSQGAREKSRIEFSRDLLQILEDHRELQFDGITTGDESWFRYLIQFDSMFVSFRDAVTPRIRPDISTKTMLTIFFTSRKLVILDALPKGHKYSQDYFV
jgi:hypothetical protein